MMVKEKPGTSSKGERSQNIQVAVRCRPTSQYEMKLASHNAVEIDPKSKDITVRQDISHLDKGNNKTFQFDKVFGPKSKQIDVYKQMVQPVVEEVLQGYNCTIFAYGQTGTGKTFTMEGERSSQGSYSWQDDPLAGIIPRALHQLFTRLNASEECAEFSVMVSFLEIYNEELFDLLGTGMDNQKLRLFEDTAKKGAIRVHGLEEVTVHSRNEVYEILERGTQRRQTAATLLNAHSSRSHSLFTVTIHMKENNINGEEFLKTGKLNLVDLAGSENIGRSGAVEKRAREAGTINTSLLTLGRVITSLVENTPHVPYRESKLTRLLKDSLGGHTKTSIIATISPAACNLEETLSTLDYASRAKCIKNKPEVNQKLTKKALIKEYTEQIEKLKKDLYAAREKNGIFLSEENFQEMQNQLQAQKGNLKEFVEKIEALEEERKKTEKLFSTTQKQLEVTAKKLNWTKQVVSEKSEIIEHHKETENELYEKGRNLIETVQETVNDNTNLHQSLMRKKQIQEANLTASQRFKDTALSQLKDLNVKMKEQEDLVRSFQDSMKCRLNTFSEERQSAENELLEYIDASKVMLAEKVDNLLSDQLVWRENQKHESAKFREEFINLKSQCLETVESLVQMQNCAMEKMRGFVTAVNNNCNAMSSTIFMASENFSTTSHEVANKHHSSIDTLRETIHSYATAEKDLFDSVKSNTSKILTDQLEIHQRVGAEIKSELMATFDELFKTKMQSVHKKLQNGAEKLNADVDTQETNRGQLLHTVESQVGSIRETITRESNEMVQSQETFSANLSKDIEKIKTETVSVNTEILEMESSEADVEAKFKDGIEKHHNCGLQYNEQVVARCNKQSTIIDDKLEKLMSSNKDVFCRINRKLAEESSKTNKFISVTMDEKDREIGVCVEQCKQSDTKVGLLQNTLVEFVEEEIVSDNPTGCTPKPKKYSYPDRLRRTEDHEKIVESFRQKTGALPVPLLKPDGEFECEEGGTEDSQDSESDASSRLNTSASSRSTIPSTGTEGDDPADEGSEDNAETEDELSPYPTPQIRKTKQTNRCDGKENVSISTGSSAVKQAPPSATKIPRTPLSSSNY